MGVAMRRVFTCIAVLAVASLGCAARRPLVVTPATDERLPRFGEYVSVEELPEVVTKVQPQYPASAREAGAEGTVMVQALVGKDGRVKDVLVTKSIPTLDAAATAAVRQWVFKPARGKNGPMAVWVAVPMKFTLR
jgi:TonB family protein